jgi:hypothetical protein
MTSQQLGDIALEEHRAVMAALLMDNIRRPTLDQYNDKLRKVSEEMSCPETIGSQSQSLSQGASQ